MENQEWTSNIALWRKNKQYDRIISAYESHHDGNLAELLSNNFIMSNVLAAYRHTRCYEKGLYLLHKIIRQNTAINEFVMREAAWTLYALLKAGLDNKQKFAFSEIKPAFEFIFFRLDPATEPLAYSRLLQKWDEFVNAVNNGAKTELLGFYSRVDSEKLSSEAPEYHQLTKTDNSVTEGMSDKERWYVRYAKLLFECKDYKQCLQICKLAQQEKFRWHFDNDFWLKRLVAKSLYYTGQTALCLQLYEKLLQQKQDWFLYKEMAVLHYHLGNYDKSLEYACMAMLTPGKPAYKVELLHLSAKLLQKKGDKHQALVLMCAEKHIRTQNDWKLPPRLQNANCNKLPTQVDKQWWSSTLHQLQAHGRQQGSILKILHPGRHGDGFVKCGNRSYYFKIINSPLLYKPLNENISVSFRLLEQQHKGRKVSNAVDLLILTEKNL